MMLTVLGGTVQYEARLKVGLLECTTEVVMNPSDEQIRNEYG